MPYPPLRHRRGWKLVIKAIEFLYCHTSYMAELVDEMTSSNRMIQLMVKEGGENFASIFAV